MDSWLSIRFDTYSPIKIWIEQANNVSVINNPYKDIYLLLNSGMNSKILLAVLMIACLSTAFEIKANPTAKPTFWQTVGCTAPDCNTCPTPDDGTCTLCNDGFYLFNPTTCEDCKTGADGKIDNCALCTYDVAATPPLKCNQCDDGFFSYTNIQCEGCSTSAITNIPNCALCTYDAVTLALTCSKCDFTFYLDQANACQSCATGPNVVANCKDCSFDLPTTTVTCNNCDAGFYAIGNTKCESCSASTVENIPNCVQCAYDAAATPILQCSQCAVGFYLSANGTLCNPCTDISNFCIECTADDNNGTNKGCTKCQDQYISQFNDCLACAAKFTNCTNCDTTNNTCNTCGPTFYRAAQGSGCVSCAFAVTNCKLCTPTGDLVLDVLCNQCNPNFFLTDPHVCTSCKDTFANCLLCDTVATTCTTCEDGFYGLTTTKCESCSASTVKNINNCFLCSYAVTTDKLTCNQCQPSYYLYNNGDQCQSCSTSTVKAVTGCADCTYDQAQDNFKCNGCTDTYYLNALATCDLCNAGVSAIAKCLTCTGTYLDVQCTSCEASYVPQTGKCVACSDAIANCLSCTGAQQNVQCTTCESSYFIKAGKCVACSDSVSDCDACTVDPISSDVSCSHCANGKVLTDGKCEDSSASTIIIVSAVVGGVVLMGAGFAIFKCMKKRKLPLAEDDYEKI